VLGNLEVYRFDTSHWEDENGNELGMKAGSLDLMHCFLIFSFWNRNGCLSLQVY
jgi:hypothetical protein